MSLRNIITENIVLPLTDKVIGNHLYSQLKFVEQSQWWSYAELINFQNEKLKILIKKAYDYVPYYKEIMDSRNLKPKDITTIDDLKKLPILTKEIFKKNYPHNMRARNWKDYNTLPASSSGSTGIPIQYLMTREGYSFNKACNLRGWYWMGYRLGDSLIKVTQNERKSFEKKIQDKLDNTRLFTSRYNEENFYKFIEMFKEHNPSYLRSYPDPLQFISIILRNKNIKLTGLKGINTTGNILFRDVRNMIEKAFETYIYDSYSCEGGPNYFECPSHECYHSSMEYGISEVLNEELEEINEGELGSLYTTDLWNYVTPFIRYQSADLVRKTKNKCSCGRELFAISEIIGRDNDVVITQQNSYVIAQTFTTYFKYIPSIKRFQIYQAEQDKLQIRLEVDNENFSVITRDAILNYWDEYFQGKMDIDIVLQDIELTGSDKCRFVIRNKKIPFIT